MLFCLEIYFHSSSPPLISIWPTVSAWQTWFLKHLIRFLVKTTRFYVISWSTVWENAEHCEIRFILNALWNIRIATWMDAHELCISEVLEEHGVPTPPNPQPPQHPHPSRSSAGWGGVLRVCLCVCVSMRSSLRAGVHRHPSVCLLQTPAGRHGTPCRKCGTSPVAQGESVYVTHKHTHTRAHPARSSSWPINQMSARSGRQ